MPLMFKHSLGYLSYVIIDWIGRSIDAGLITELLT
jgi:hypothetical protein